VVIVMRHLLGASDADESTMGELARNP